MREERIKEAEMLYGKESGQCELQKMLLEAESQLKTTGKLQLAKMCAQEYIIITYVTDIFKKDRVTLKRKSHWNLDKTQLKKKKEKELNISITSLVDNEVYDLILNGKYEIL